MRRPTFAPRSLRSLRATVGRPAFAVLELIIVIGILATMTSLSIPAYREYQIRSDLDRTTQQVTQGLARAKLLSTSGERDSAWGFYVPSGTLYKGQSYADRDASFDEVYPMPSTIAVTGLLDVAYSRISGLPADTGDIVLRALNNDERIIQVTIAVDQQSLATNHMDLLTICHHNVDATTQTMTIPDATWPYHQGHGDTNGACVAPASSSAPASSAPASSSSAAASSVASSAPASSSSAAGGGGGGSSSSAGACGMFTLAADQTITLSAASTVTFTNMLSQITYGAGGPVVPVHLCYSKNNGSSWSPLFGGNGNCNGNGNAYGNAVQPAGTDTKTVSVGANSALLIKVTGRYVQHNWLTFFGSFISNASQGHIIYLRNGDTLATYPGFGSQTPLKNYLTGKGMLNAQGKIVLTSCQVLAVSELGTLGSASADFQDDVLLMSFN